MRFRDDMLRPKVLVFMLPLLLPIGRPNLSVGHQPQLQAEPAAPASGEQPPLQDWRPSHEAD